MGAEGAVAILSRREIAENPNCKEQLVHEYEEKFLNPYIAAKRGFIDEVIKPEDTRNKIVSALEMLQKKGCDPIRRKHGNIPL